MASGIPKQETDEEQSETKGIKDILWDPFFPSDWDQQKPSSEAIVRIKRDLQGVFSDPPPGIFIVPQGDDITRLNVLIIGPFDTPYEGGFFHFFVRFPPSYPHHPPRVKFITTGDGRVRFNPNLYRNGKVCLSILGDGFKVDSLQEASDPNKGPQALFQLPVARTWPGPQWTASQNLFSVVISIQSLLNEKPFHNEPGFVKQIGGWEVESYNDVIRHETLRVAVCDALERENYPKEHMEVIKCSFMECYEYYITTAQENSTKLDKQAMMDPFGFNKGIFNFAKLIERLKAIHSKLERTKKSLPS